MHDYIQLYAQREILKERIGKLGGQIIHIQKQLMSMKAYDIEIDLELSASKDNLIVMQERLQTKLCNVESIIMGEDR